MPIYNLKNQLYNIPNELMDSFEKDNPDATISYQNGDDVYQIPASKRVEFVKQFPNAVAYDGNESENKGEIVNAVSGGVGTQEQADSLFAINQKRLREKDPRKRAALDMEYNNLKTKMIDGDKKDLRGLIEDNGEIQRLQRIQGEAQLEIDKSSFFDRYFNPETRAAVAARDAAEEALDTYSEAKRDKDGWFERNVEGVLRGFFDKVGDLRTWDFGASGVSSAIAIKEASEKLERGEKLSPVEQNMLDAYGLASAIQASYQDQVSTAYNVGGSLPESFGFMASLALNPAGGVGKKIAESAAKRAVKKYGTSLVSKLAKGAARVGGDVVEMGVATAIPGAGRVAEDYYNRLNGQSTFDVDDKGIIRYGGQIEQEEADDAIWKAFGSQFIENYSEAMGNYFAPMGTMLSNLTSKGLKAAHLNKFSEAITDISSSQFSKGLQRFKDAVKFNGLVGEYLEEVAGNFMNAATVGDMNFKSPEDPRSVFNPDTNIETFLSCALMSGTMYAIEAPVTLYNKHTAKKNLRNADVEASKLWEDRWSDMREQMDSASPEHLAQILTGIQNATDLSDEQKHAAKVYASRLMQSQGYNARMAQNTQETTEGANEANKAYDEGSENESPEYVYNANKERNKAADALMSVDKNVKDIIDQAIEKGESVETFLTTLEGNVASLARDYYNKSMRMRGVADGITDRAEETIKADNQFIDSVTDPSTGMYTEVDRIVVENGEMVRQHGYIVGWINDAPVFLAEGLENTQENRVILKPNQWDKDSMQQLPNDRVKAINEEMVREEAAVRMDEESKYAPEVLKSQMQQGVPFDTPTSRIVPISPMPEGNGWVVEEYAMDTENKLSKMPIAREMTTEEYRDIMQAQYEAQQAESAPSESVGEQVNTEVNNPMGNAESTPMTPMETQGSTPMSPMSSPMSEEVQSATEEKSTQPVIPTKKDGSIDFVAYGREGTLKTLGEKYGEKMPNKVAVTAKALAEDVVKAEEKLAKAEEAYDNAPIGREQKAEQARDKARQELEEVKKEADYWKAIDEEIKEAQKAREAIVNPKVEVDMSDSPQTVDEFVAQQLASGNIVLTSESFKKETGYGEKERKKFPKLFRKAENGGLTIEQAGERLMEMDRENGTNFFDQEDANAGRDAIINMLGSVRSWGDITGYIKNNREQQANRDAEGLRNEIEEAIESNYHMTPEDYATLQEMESVENPFGELDVATKDAIFVEAEEEYQSYLNSLENGQGTTEEVAEGNGNVLSEERTDDTGGTPERQGERPDVSEGVVQQNDAAQETEQVEEPLSIQKGESPIAFAERVVEEERRKPLRARAREWSSKLGVKVKIMESLDDVTNPSAKRAISSGQAVTGWFEESTGEVCLYMPNISSLEEVDATYIHEVVSHKGLRGLLGDKFDSFCDEVWDMMSNADRLKFMEYPGVSHLKGQAKSRAAADEYIAFLSENVNVTEPTWNKFTELVKKFLKAIGLEPKMTNADIANTIKKSYQRLLSGETAEDGVSGDGTRFRTLEEINQTFNEELQQQIDGTLPNGHIYQLGSPSAVLRSAGIEDLPIELAASRLVDKSMQDNHPFELSEVENLPEAIHNPLAVFVSATKVGSNVILTELKHGGKNFVAALRVRPNKKRIEVNQIRSLYPKNTNGIIDWINNGLATYVDKGRMVEWVEKQRNELLSKPQSNSVEVREQLASATKIVNDFENPTLPEEKSLFRVVYHGSAASFDKFSKDFIGSGEGQSVMGHGFYVTTSGGTAEYYANVASENKRKIVQEGGYTFNGEVVRDRALVSAYELLKDNNFDADKAIEKANHRIEIFKKRKGIFANTATTEKAIEYLEAEKNNPGSIGYQEEIVEKPSRVRYEVEIPDDNGKNYLDLDKKATKKFKDESKKRMIEILDNGEEASYWKKHRDVINNEWESVDKSDATNDTVRGTMEQFISQEEVANIFSEMGYVGSKAKASDGTTYIIYNEDDIEIKSSTRFRMTNAEKEELRDSKETKALFDYAKKRFGRTFDLREAGYILPDGVMLDFSGRHEMEPGSDTSYLAGYRSVDHRYVADLNYEPEDDGGEKTGFNTDMADFINRGAIRMDGNIGSINLTMKPTSKQKTILQRLIQRMDGDVWVDFGNGWDTEHSAEYSGVRPMRVLSDIDKYYDEGIKPEGNTRFRIANRNQEVFVSNAQKAVEGIKQEKATPQQWLAMIEKNGGLKAGEDKWLGLSDWLKGLDKKSVTKEEILDFIGENKIRIEEVHYGEGGSIDELRNKYPMWDEAFEIDDDFGGVSVSLYNDKNAADIYNEANPESKVELQKSDRGYEYLNAEDEEKVIDWARTQIVSISPINSTRLNYTTEGLDNKQEIALTVPTIESWNESDEIHFGDAGEGRAIAWVRFGETFVMEDDNYIREVTEVKEPYRDVNGLDIYKTDSGSQNDFIAHGKGRNGEMIYVAYVNGRQIPVAHKTLEDAKAEMNKFFKEHPIKNRKSLNVLVIDEIQSKRHQEGRDKGYRTEETTNKLIELKRNARASRIKLDNFTDSIISKYGVLSGEALPRQLAIARALSKANEGDVAKYHELEGLADNADKLYTNYENEHGNISNRVPDAPFEKNWSELAMKRMLRYAAENGYDKVAWTTGAQQAERYNLGTMVKDIEVWAATDPATGEVIEGEYDVYTHSISGNFISEATGRMNNERVVEVFGKDLGNRIIQGGSTQQHTVIEGEGLSIGGEGMKGFYDKMLPSFVNKYVKKWGTKVQDIELPNVEEAGRIMHSVDVTDAMKESVMQGQTMFRVASEPAIDYVSQANDVVEVPRDEVLYTMNNIASQLYKMSGNYMRQLYKYGTLGRVLKGDYAEIDQIKAKNEYDHAKPIFDEYLNELVWMKYQSTEAAQEVINGVISDVEYAMQYYKDLALGKDVWRTDEKPRFRIVEKQREEAQKQVDDFTSKYKSKPVAVVESSMSDEELERAIPTLLPEDIRKRIDNGLIGGYSTIADKIYIFADNVSGDTLEDTLFHENLHPMFKGNPMIEEFYNNFKAKYPEQVEMLSEGYKESEIPEELFVAALATGMQKGNFKIVDAFLSDGAREELGKTLKSFGYDYEQERGRRHDERNNGESSEVARDKEVDERSGRKEDGEEERTKAEQSEELRKLFERVASEGLRGVVGDAAYDMAMIDIYHALPEKERVEVSMNAVRNLGGNVAAAVDEYLESKNNSSLWDKVAGIIRDVLRKAGFDLDLTENDVKYLLWRSKKPLDKGNLLDLAEDIDMRYRLKVGEYSTNDDGTTPDGGGTRFRTKKKEKIDLADNRDAIIKKYDEELKSHSFNFQEAFQDRMLSVKVLMDLIEQETGKKARSFEDAYKAENQLGSINKPAQEKWLETFYKPLLEEMNKLTEKYGRKEVENYIYCKSGLERNEVLRQRDADEAYEEAKEELDSKLAKKEIDQSQYNTLLQMAEDQRKKTLSEDVDYSGIRGLLMNTRAEELFEQYQKGTITETEYKQKVADLKKNEEQVIKDWKKFAENQVSYLENKASKNELNALWDKINAATNETLRIDFESGMIDRETYEAEKKMMKYYVPLRNWENTTAEEMYEYRHDMTPAVSSNQKRAKGRKTQADNPIATIALMAQNAIVRGNRNKMKINLYSFVVNRPTALASVRNVWYVKNANNKWEPQYADTSAASNQDEINQIMEQFESDMQQLAEQGKAFKGKIKQGMHFQASRKQKDEHVVTVMINGKEYGIYINGNPRAAQAMNGMTNAEGVDDAGKWIDALKRYYGAGLTSWNPDFIIPNMVRDTIHATTMTFLDKGVIESAKYAWNVPKMFTQITKEVTGISTGDPKLHKYFEEFVTNGGETGYTAIHTLEDYKKEYERLVNEAKGVKSSIAKGGKNLIKELSKILEAANRIAEDVNRFNAYVTSRESGENIKNSIDAAKNITVNFNRKGALSANNTVYGKVASLMSRWILFFNPSVQGIHQLVTKSKANPKRAMAMGATILSSGFLVPMINEMLVAAFGGDDEDDYWNQSDYKRRNNLMLFAGDGYVSIPLPPVLRELYGMGDIMYGVITGHIPAQRAIYDTLRQIQSAVGFVNLLPEVSQEPDMITYAKGFAPDLAAPLLDVISNTNFMGRPIAKWTDYNEYDPEYMRVYKGVSPQWIELSKLLNEVGGNETRRSDKLGNFINPAMMEHLFTSYTGGIGKTINNLAGMIVDAATGNTENMDIFRKTPIIPRFYTPNDEKTVHPAINRKYYEFEYQYNNATKSLKKAKEGVKSGEHPEWQKYIDEMDKNGEQEFIKYFKKEQKKLKKLQDKLKEEPNNKEYEKKVYDKKAEISLESFKILSGQDK